MSETRVELIRVAGDPDTWRSIGLAVTADGVIALMGTSLRIESVDGVEPGIVGWALSGVDAGTTTIAGLETIAVEPQAPQFAQHRLGAIELDHVVVMTSDLESTTAAIGEATGYELKRVREVGQIRQGFHRIGRGGLIVEVVNHVDDRRESPDFWGVVINVDDLDAACEVIGAERISAPKDAVQPGRRIATIRGAVGLGFPVALMSR